jgi:hypothetical protein
MHMLKSNSYMELEHSTEQQLPITQRYVCYCFLKSQIVIKDIQEFNGSLQKTCFSFSKNILRIIE